MTISQRLERAGSTGSRSARAPLADRAARPGRLARLAARARAGSLDRALIAGADPARSPQLSARAALLTSPRTRTAIAGGLERLVEAARGPRGRWCAVSAGAPLLASAAELLELAELLRGRAPLYARGVAMLNELISDGTGPAYHGERDELARVLREARSALAG